MRAHGKPMTHEDRSGAPGRKKTTPASTGPAFQHYQAAVQLLQQGRYEKALAAFEKLLPAAPPTILERCQMYINTCRRQLEKPKLDFPTPEEHYDFAVSLMNLGDFVTAREHLEKLSNQRPALDFIWYGFAVLECLTGRTSESLQHLAEAIRLNPGNRFQARNDSDFRNMADDPRFTELLYPEGALGA